MQTAKVSLPDGRTLAYAEYGDPTGYPLVWCHGNPGSRREADLLDPTLLQRLGVRAIVPDRPGIGLSTWRAQRKLNEWPTDLAALTAAINIERFALVGISAGAPYALACARAMPHRITRAGIISGLGPLDVLDAAARRKQSAQYFVLPPADQRALSEPRTRQSFLNMLHEALRQGTRGMAWDAVLVAHPWGFDLRNITLPVYLWHGDADLNAPLAMGGAMAEQLPHSYFHILPGEGHFSAVVRHMPSILQTLVVPNDFVSSN